MKKHIYLAALGLILIVVAGAVIYSTHSVKDCDKITGAEKRNDCFHSLAHELSDKNICNKINDSELKGHCFEHIPE